MKKALIGLVAIVAVVASLAVWQADQPRKTPPGQPPLEALTERNLADFTNAFNGFDSSVRLVLLLSPT